MRSIPPAFKPSQYQEQVKRESKIRPLSSASAQAIMDTDVLFVGGGPAGLTGAIRLKQLCQKTYPDIQIAVLEKASRIGGHSLSGAVVNPVVLKQLFPNTSLKSLPLRQAVQKEKLFYLTSKRKWPLWPPPSMKNKHFYTASLCEIMRWMGKKAEADGVHIWTSFSADELLVENNQVCGVSTTPIGLKKDGTPGPAYQEPVFIRSKLTVLADGSRGHLSQAWMRWKNISSRYSQTYALGVKELWEVPSDNLSRQEETIIHTLGWPLPPQVFGGAWIYPLGDNLLSIGLVAGLDSPLPDLDVHEKLQALKSHPLMAGFLKEGRCVEWGAKTIPEGGYHAMPERLYDDGLLIAGDSAGMVNVPALKGIHYAMTAGWLSAEVAFSALKAEDFSSKILKNYAMAVEKSCIGQDLYLVRNVRQAFEKNIFQGLFKSGLMFLSQGLFPGDGKVQGQTDAEKPRRVLSGKSLATIQPSKSKDQLKGAEQSSQLSHQRREDQRSLIHSLSKQEAVYLSGNKTRDDIPAHLKVPLDLPDEIKKFYTHLCPAGVYEYQNGQWTVNAPNCIDCKATDILGPFWSPREGGAGPNYTRM